MLGGGASSLGTLDLDGRFPLVAVFSQALGVLLG